MLIKSINLKNIFYFFKLKINIQLNLKTYFYLIKIYFKIEINLNSIFLLKLFNNKKYGYTKQIK